MGQRVAAVVMMAGLLASPITIAAPPEQPAQAEPEPEPEPGDLSEQGTRRGGLEIGLGVLLSGAGVGLIAFGTVQLIRAREHVEFCNRGITFIDEMQEPQTGIDPCVFDPPALGFASAGLSWGFSIPLLVGGGMLFHRARRVIADARGFDRVRVTASPWWGRSGAGGTLVLRF